MTRHRLATVLLAGTVAVGLAACGTDDPAVDVDPDVGSEQPGDDAEEPDMADPDEPVEHDGDQTSMPADDEDVQQRPTSVTEGEATAIGTAYLGLTVEQAEEQGVVDGRTVRFSRIGDETFALTEDYVIGRVTLAVEDGVVVQAVVEATDGPVTVEG